STKVRDVRPSPAPESATLPSVNSADRVSFPQRSAVLNVVIFVRSSSSSILNNNKMSRRNQAGEGEGSSNIRYNIIDGKALDPMHFSPEIVNMLNFQGLLNTFLRIEDVVYPDLVNQFYQNMKVKTVNQVPVLTSIVKGVKITFDPPKLAKLLSLPLGGVSQYERHVWIET
ncbi:hypothetical protein, partial [Escherichia coli]|uniref:hypothetical protein n=1 Tax=Escherichia coli TaxID=562 RepID=UPI0032DA3A24